MKTFWDLVARIRPLYVVYVVSAGVILYCATSPAIADPIVNFCFAGIVPGTDIVLDPAAVMLGVAGVLGAGLASVLLVWLLRRVRAVRRGRIVRGATPSSGHSSGSPVLAGEGLIFEREGGAQSPSAPKVRSAPHSVQVSRAAAQPAQRRHVFRPQIQFGWLRELARGVSASIRSGSSAIVRVYRWSAAAIATGLDWEAVALARAGKLLVRASGDIRRGAVVVWCWLVPQVRRGWAAALPHLRQLDTWLELRYRGVLARVHRVALRYEFLQVVMQMSRDGRSSLKRRTK